MVSVLRFAYDYDCESQLAAELLQQNPLPELQTLQKRFLRHYAPQPDIPTKQHTADTYDYRHFQDQAAENAWSYSQYLAALCEQEVAQRFQTEKSHRTSL